MNSFTDCFEYSIGSREQFDIELLKSHIRCESVEKTDDETDKLGIDYIVTFKDGSKMTVDAKTRKPGAKRYWTDGPELALEQYSVVENKKIGWLFKRSETHPDYILYTFDKSDTDNFYIIPFVLLKKAAFINWSEWEKQFGIKKQPNSDFNGYTSSALFVPASIVLEAVAKQMTGTRQRT